MKKVILIGGVLSTSSLFGQVGINTSNPHPSSILTVAPTDVNGRYRGSLLSPMTTAQINSIANPAKGLIAYDLIQKCLKVNYGIPTAPRWACIKIKQ